MKKKHQKKIKQQIDEEYEREEEEGDKSGGKGVFPFPLLTRQRGESVKISPCPCTRLFSFF